MATAEQIVGAVLDATNKRYVVETYKTDDGLGGYTLYSDGFCEQWGVYFFPSLQTQYQDVVVPLYKEFKNTNYFTTATVFSNRGNWVGTYISHPNTANSIKINCAGETTEGPAWQAKGYVA